eukprot:492526_1
MNIISNRMLQRQSIYTRPDIINVTSQSSIKYDTASEKQNEKEKEGNITLQKQENDEINEFKLNTANIVKEIEMENIPKKRIEHSISVDISFENINNRTKNENIDNGINDMNNKNNMNINIDKDDHDKDMIVLENIYNNIDITDKEMNINPLATIDVDNTNNTDTANMNNINEINNDERLRDVENDNDDEVVDNNNFIQNDENINDNSKQQDYQNIDKNEHDWNNNNNTNNINNNEPNNDNHPNTEQQDYQSLN